MDDFFALSKEEAPDNIPMMFITMPSAKDPEAKIRHPGTKSRYFLYCSHGKLFKHVLKLQIKTGARLPISLIPDTSHHICGGTRVDGEVSCVCASQENLA